MRKKGSFIPLHFLPNFCRSATFTKFLIAGIFLPILFGTIFTTLMIRAEIDHLKYTADPDLQLSIICGSMTSSPTDTNIEINQCKPDIFNWFVVYFPQRGIAGKSWLPIRSVRTTALCPQNTC